jgi:hypothetical protein
MDTAAPTRESFQLLQRLLLSGAVSFLLVVGILLWLGAVPLLPEPPVPDVVPVVVTAMVQLMAWFWARRRVPRRRPMQSATEFWKDASTLSAAHLALFLFEGSAMIATVWTMLTASPATLVMAVLGMAGVAASGPAAYEEPDV